MDYITPNPPVLSAPVRRDQIVTDIQTALSTYVIWIEASAGRAYRLTTTNKKAIAVPDVYVSPKEYFRATPNENIKGQSFVLLNDESYGNTESWEPYAENIFQYSLDIIISYNLDKIDKSLFQGYYFSEQLKQDVIDVISQKLTFSREITAITDEPSSVWTDFDFDIGRWSKAPMGAFKITLAVTQTDKCGTVDYQNALELAVQGMTAAELQAAMTAQQITDLSALICP